MCPGQNGATSLNHHPGSFGLGYYYIESIYVHTEKSGGRWKFILQGYDKNNVYTSKYNERKVFEVTVPIKL